MDVEPICSIFKQLDRELWLVTSQNGSRQGGLIATFVSQASLCPVYHRPAPGSLVPVLPRVLIGLARQHHTRELIDASSVFALHLLGEEHLDWVWRFGLHSGRDLDKLEGLAHSVKATGSPVLTGARGWLDCRVETCLETGDRTVYLAEVLAGDMVRPGPLLTFQRLLQLAPADRLQQLKDALAHDSQIDGDAIQAWRQGR